MSEKVFTVIEYLKLIIQVTKLVSNKSAPIQDSDQPAHQRSLIQVFDACSMGTQGFNVSSDIRLKL